MSEKRDKNKEMDKDFETEEVKNSAGNNNPEDDHNTDNEVGSGDGKESESNQLEADLQKEKDNFLRLFAEFENYKKRTARERIELFSTANKELMTALLPVLDDFDRGLKEIEKSSDKALLDGMKLIYNKFKNTLIQKGLTEVEVKQGDTFDADLHEAITQIPAPSKKLKGKIVDVIEKGYKLGDTIIRFPKVVTGS